MGVAICSGVCEFLCLFVPLIEAINLETTFEHQFGSGSIAQRYRRRGSRGILFRHTEAA
jgi:hypothetical protein